ncbi:DNA-binding transcriptional regulator OxyR [Veronia nyctiphanis]|uniref:DNA-binding transcriptional regulator OxyR n=1 Tax=Veronia nyctiphanis TaxID=1278244 RepID=A0A4V1LSZ9_9GAMM|nr:DNA-binding transcriptional regulator OxyR [Veronia nyctiphanis]RXJ73458.1 DNA-binding transcriptional regulator OxyR [Veronia nyctiphanis]
MNIRDLEYLVALAEHQHFRKAAEACFVSQPTLSGQIRKLEDSLGVPLLERNSRRVLFTDAGMRLVKQAQNVLLEVKVLKEMASDHGESMSGPLHIGFIPTVGPYLLPLIVREIKSQFPELELFLYEAQTHDLVQRLEEGKIDCAVMASVRETSHLVEIEVYHEPMWLAVPDAHPWSAKEEVPMLELNGLSLLMLADGHCLRDQALGFCFAAGASDDTRFKATSLETVRNMVAAGNGITLIPELAIPKSRQEAGVHYLKATDPVPSREISLSHRPGSPLKARYQKLATVISQCVNDTLS